VNQKPLVSVIITTKNEADVIFNLLKSVAGQTYPNTEIIVVDNNSTDETVKIAKGFTKKVYNQGPERSAQRNYGARKAIGEYLLFLDADMELSPKVIEECVDSAQKGAKAAIIPEISIGKRFWEKVKAFERSFYFDQGSFAVESARFFTKNVFEAVGGYDETITGTEDWDLSETVRKRGYKVARIKAEIYHYETIPSLANLAKKFYYYGLTAPRTLAKQNTAIISPKNIHFLRPAFYKKWYLLIAHPVLTLAMIFMLTVQITASGVGYLVGKVKKV